jgi:hypothetical protein
MLVAGGRIEPPTLGYESPTRQKLKSLPFRMVAATENFRAFPIPSLSFRFRRRYVLLIPDTIWPQKGGVKLQGYQRKEKNSSIFAFNTKARLLTSGASWVSDENCRLHFGCCVTSIE